MQDVESGRIDYAANSFISNGVPNTAIPHLLATYGLHGSARRPSSPRFVEHPSTTVNVLLINATRPLFHNVNLRKAVQYALDRVALTADLARAVGAAEPLDRPISAALLPRLPRREPVSGSTRLRKGASARRGSPGHRDHVRVSRLNQHRSDHQQGPPIGIDVVVKEFPVNDLLTRERRPGEPYDLFLGGYGGTYQDPADIFDPSIGRAGVIASNHFRDPAIDRQFAAAEQLTGQARIRAYTQLDIELARNLAPAAAFSTELVPDFLSGRMGCEVYQPVYGIDLAALCLRPK
jgi:ABC-type transport system substrate-binding protein